MRKLVTLLVLIFAFTLTTKAQKKAEKILSKMTTDLNLTIAQQNEIRPLLEAQIIDKKMMDDKKKEQNKSGKKPSKEAQKKLKKIKKAKKTAMNVKMASILDKAQLIKYHLLKEAIKKKKEMDSKKKKDN